MGETELDHLSSGRIRFEPPSARWNTVWRDAYQRYAAALAVPVDDAIATTVWSWLLAGTHGLEALLALDGERLAGFAHFRPFPRTLNGNEAGYLDDLWVAESHRGKGLGRALIEQVCAIGRERGWTEVRWVSERGNEAHRLYERIATNWGLLTYRIPLSR
ncbi:MAG TPA: GNAT family N-acetyltransferase [Candidatus Acidoferrum sp.]|nr:GNAT family N-acetyltransferase [Candidatus Acidoferrum sp.]